MTRDTPKRFIPPDAVRYINRCIDDMVALERPVADCSVATQAGNQAHSGMNDVSCKSLTFRH